MQQYQNTQTVIIAGGGLVGLTTAIALARIAIPSIVIEPKDLHQLANKEIIFDGRVSAIARGSREFLEKIGIWEKVADKAGPINQIRVVDEHSPLFLHFKDEQKDHLEPMGHMLPNHWLHKALIHTATEHPLITIHRASIQSITHEEPFIHLTTDQGQNIQASLLVGADGKRSFIRETMGISSIKKPYHQTAIVCNVHHETDHQGIAVEHFMKAGPFAILPMHGGHHSSIVWTETTQNAPIYTKMEKELFLVHLQEKIGDFLGELTLASDVFSYPLELVKAQSLMAARTALIGDAAHSIHPIAGQGYNLGVRDVEGLSKALQQQSSVGLDIGNQRVLQQYQQQRQLDVNSMVWITDRLNTLFQHDNTIIQHGRRLGLYFVQKIPPLKQFFMSRAMGQ